MVEFEKKQTVVSIEDTEFEEASSVVEAIKFAYVEKDFTYQLPNKDMLVFGEDGEDYVLSGTDYEEVCAVRDARSGLSHSVAFIHDIRKTSETLSEVWPFHGPKSGTAEFEKVINTIWKYNRLMREVDRRSSLVEQRFYKFVGQDVWVSFEDIYIRFVEFNQLAVGGSYDLEVRDLDKHYSKMTVTTGAIAQLGLMAVKSRFDLEHDR
jgi:hypothetical protein